MRALTLAAVFLAAAGVFAAQAGRDRGDDAPSEDLARLIGEMEQREAVLRDLTRQEKSVTRALGELDESIARMDREAARLDDVAARAEARVHEAELEAARLNRDLEHAEARLRRRLQAAMKLGPSADIQMMLGAHSLKDLVWRRHVMRRVAAADAELVKEVDARRLALLREREAVEQRRRDVADSKATLDQARNAAAQVRLARAQTLTELAMQKGAAQRRLHELSAARRRLQLLVDELPGPAAATGFGALKGRLEWPAAGEIDVPFGPRVDEASGVETLHSGISIVAPLGEKVRAVAKGRVVHAGWLRGFGQLLIVDHGDGYHTLLAHLSRITVDSGDEVAEGDVVAYVGDSESLVGPRLYFELRARGRPVNPVIWLKH